MEYIRITKENIDKEHICCAMSGKQSLAKKEWLKQRFEEGLVFYRSAERGKCFIEYIPAENAWVPIDADAYLYINCLWVSGSLKGHGYSSELLEECLRDAKAQGKNGVCILCAEGRKREFLADPKFLTHKGFKVSDISDCGINLMYLPLAESAPQPKFKDCAKHPKVEENGFVLYYAAFLDNARFRQIQGEGEGRILTADGAPVYVRLYKKDAVDVNQKYLDALRRALEQADGLDRVFAHHITNKSGKYIVFCANKEHMDEMVSHVPEWFAGVNSNAVVYQAYSDDPNTDKAFADFKTDTSDRLKLLFCIDMLNEGVHVEGISGVILFRPTISPIIYKQQIGRALTAGDNTTPLILDVVNNFEGLTSISGLQGEMQEAVHRLYANGEGDKIVTERFEVIEQVHDCRVLFEQLQASLSSGWEHYFSEASIYYAEHGNLNVPKLYTTPGGLSLGVWLVTQRRVREGQIQGILTEQQIQRLDSIGMVWGNRKEIAWQHGFEVAKKYHDTYGNLMVPGKYVDPDGYPLGQWIIKTRQQKLNGRLKEERIAQLDEIGMVWNIFDAKWEKAYALAAAYYEENGNLNIPRSYVTAAGERLGQWVESQQWAYPKGKLTDEQVERLSRIGMYWGNRNDRKWNEGYQEAKRYFDAHGDLNVPAEYVSPGGYNLGNWVKRQRYTRQNPEKSGAVLTEERIAKLDEIGMRWGKSNPKHPSKQAAQAERVTAKAG